MNTVTMIAGADLVIPVQITTDPYPEGLMIKNSTAANPSVLEIQLPHKFINGDKARISGHRPNTIVNGQHTVTVVDALRFSVPVTGDAVGDNTGRVSKIEDITNYVFSVKTKKGHGGAEITDAAPTWSITVAVNGTGSISLTPTQTSAIAALGLKSCIIEVTYIDTDSKTWKFSIECEVKNA